MTCRELIEFLMSYIDGELADDRRSLFDEHLANCPDCVTYLETYRKTVALETELLGASLDALVPGDVPEDLVRAILSARES